MTKGQAVNTGTLTKLMFRLLPIQILLAAIGQVNSLVSGYFASNYVGVEAMTAVGLYSPLNMLANAFSMMMVGGAAILCGKYLGRNDQEKLQNTFSVSLVCGALVSIVLSLVYLATAMTDLSLFFTKDPAVLPLFKSYLAGQALGVFPLVIGNLMAAFLSMENKQRRTVAASLTYIAANVLLNFLFVQAFRLEALGLALSSSIGLWIFMACQAQYFLSGKSHLKIRTGSLRWRESLNIIRVGFPGAASNGYQALRGLIVNALVAAYVGSVGISACTAADALLRVFWAVPMGMQAVSRMMISISVGEEDRQTLTDVMRVLFWRFVPLMSLISLGIILCAEPLARVYYKNTADPVYEMTVWGLRILPLCIPLSLIYMVFVCYCQAMEKERLVHFLSLLDGVVCVAGFTALLIPVMGLNSVYIASVLNGVVTTSVIFGYAWLKNGHFPRNMDDLMVIPDEFGAPEEERMDLSVRRIEEVVSISQKVQEFCLEREIDERRAYLAGLSMEEMAGNIVDHGFAKDSKKHSVDVRVVHKDDGVIMRIKDDCVPFDPGERQKISDPGDVSKNIGIRMVFKTAQDVQYQNILGLNVLTIRI